MGTLVAMLIRVLAFQPPRAGSYPGKPNPALLGTQLFTTFMG